MPIKHLFAGLFILCLFASCKKNSGSDSSGNANKLKSYIEDVQIGSSHVTDTFAVAYDNDNRIISVTSPNLGFVYTYSDKSFTLDLYENGQLSIHEIAWLNSIPYVDSTFQFDNIGDTTTEGYIYTGNQLTRETIYSYSNGVATIDTRDDYTYDNSGNVIKDVQTDGQGNVNTIFTYTYTNKPMNVKISPIYYAPASKYLPATQQHSNGTGNPTASVIYSYVFDSSGRLTKETDLINNSEVDTKTFIYE
jgi:hypothetical protein